MVAPYARPPGANFHDLQEARHYEQVIAGALPAYRIDKTDSTIELDFWVPGFYLDVKEKKQPLTARWHLLEAAHEDTFVLDELSLRKALKHYPYAYFLLRDRPLDRLFLAGCWELACVRRTRVNRQGKGKLLLDLNDFRQVTHDTFVSEVMADLATVRWGVSECVGAQPPPQV